MSIQTSRFVVIRSTGYHLAVRGSEKGMYQYRGSSNTNTLVSYLAMGGNRLESWQIFSISPT